MAPHDAKVDARPQRAKEHEAREKVSPLPERYSENHDHVEIEMPGGAGKDLPDPKEGIPWAGLILGTILGLLVLVGLYFLLNPGTDTSEKSVRSGPRKVKNWWDLPENRSVSAQKRVSAQGWTKTSWIKVIGWIIACAMTWLVYLDIFSCCCNLPFVKATLFLWAGYLGVQSVSSLALMTSSKNVSESNGSVPMLLCTIGAIVPTVLMALGAKNQMFKSAHLSWIVPLWLICISLPFGSILKYWHNTTLPEGGEYVKTRDGSELFVQTKGKQNKEGTLFFLSSGAGIPSCHWENYVNELSSETQVCYYDRPGFGFSKSQGSGITSLNKSADNIHDILMHLKPKKVIFFCYLSGEYSVRTWIHKYGGRGPEVESLVSIYGWASDDAFQYGARADNSSSKVTIEEDFPIVWSGVGYLSGLCAFLNDILPCGLYYFGGYIVSFVAGHDVPSRARYVADNMSSNSMKGFSRELPRLKNLCHQFHELNIQIRPLYKPAHPLHKPLKNEQIPVLHVCPDRTGSEPKKYPCSAWMTERSELGKLVQDDESAKYWRIMLEGVHFTKMQANYKCAKQSCQAYRKFRKELAKLR